MIDSQTTPEPPDTIYLLDDGDTTVWCEVPDPDWDSRDVWEYKKVRKVANAEN